MTRSNEDLEARLGGDTVTDIKPLRRKIRMSINLKIVDISSIFMRQKLEMKFLLYMLP